ncbi:MAG: hypothetical protein B6I19_09485 [Bacteroidetes bacterium 4572_114]|nr:MAG: hypothetical protein B6I19_09485 [Bacteroidetes bacterium 4572_114]
MASLMALLGSENSLPAKYLLAFTNLKHGDNEAGEDVLNSIPSQFMLGQGQLAAHQQITDYYALLSASQYDSLCILQADSSVVNSVWDIMDAEIGLSSVFARNILLAMDETSYTEPVILPDLYKSTEALEAYHKLLETVPPKYIMVKPNPAKDYIVLEYMLEQEGNILIEISNMNGNKMYGHKALSRRDEITIDTRSWQPGIYIVTLIQDDKLIESSKFTLID